MLLKGCLCLFGCLGTSPFYKAFPSSSGSHSPTAKVSAVGRKMLSRAGISSRNRDTICGLCTNNGSAGEAHSFLSCTSCRTASSSTF